MLCGALSYYSIRAAVATHNSQKNTLLGYERATELEPEDPKNWANLARYLQLNLENPDTQRAIFAYKKALSLNPLDADSWVGLASAYESVGSTKAAREAYVEATRAYPQSADIFWQYGNFLLRQGELPEGFARIRYSLEKDPSLASEAISRCWKLDSNITTMLEQVLPATPRVYLDTITFLLYEKETDAALVVWDRLVQLRARIDLREIHLLMEVLFQQGRALEANKVWSQALQLTATKSPPRSPDSIVWDGGFESDVVDLGFAWRFHDYLGAIHGFDRNIKHSGDRSLRIRFIGMENLAFGGACEFVAIEPRIEYEFEGWLRTENITSDRGVNFLLSSPGYHYSQATPELVGTHDWTKFVLRWKNETGAHLLQVCVARQASSSALEKISGTVWADDISVKPVSHQDSDVR